MRGHTQPCHIVHLQRDIRIDQIVREHVAGRQEAAVPAAPASPGLFSANLSGLGQAQAFNDGSLQNEPLNPAAAGTEVVFYGTGFGPMVREDAEGFGMRPVLPLTLWVQGWAADIVEAGAPTDETGAYLLAPGVTAVRARIPEGVPPGPALSVRMRAGSEFDTPGATLAVSPGVHRP